MDDCLNKILAKSAFVRIPESSANSTRSTRELTPTQWWDGSLIGDPNSSPPLYTKWTWPEGCCPYYRTSLKTKAKTFTHGDGSVYRTVYDRILRTLTIENAAEKDLDERISHDGKHYFLTTSFFECIYQLIHVRKRKDVRFAIRTFGSDLPDVAKAVTAFSEGKHPLYPDFCYPELSMDDTQLYRIRWNEKSEPDHVRSSTLPSEDLSAKTDDTRFTLYKLNELDKTIVATGDHEVLDVIEGKSSSVTHTGKQKIILGIQDDYYHWKWNNYSPTCGKPVWIRCARNSLQSTPAKMESSPTTHHIIFDDNIHNDPNDSIVAIRKETFTPLPADSGKNRNYTTHFITLSGDDTLTCNGKYMVRVPTVDAVLDEEWFLGEISRCEENVLNI